jgi:hypothetical protein
MRDCRARSTLGPARSARLRSRRSVDVHAQRTASPGLELFAHHRVVETSRVGVPASARQVRIVSRTRGRQRCGAIGCSPACHWLRRDAEQRVARSATRLAAACGTLVPDSQPLLSIAAVFATQVPRTMRPFYSMTAAAMVRTGLRSQRPASVSRKRVDWSRALAEPRTHLGYTRFTGAVAVPCDRTAVLSRGAEPLAEIPR